MLRNNRGGWNLRKLIPALTVPCLFVTFVIYKRLSVVSRSIAISSYNRFRDSAVMATSQRHTADPAVRQIQTALETAKSSGASQDVIDAIQSAVELARLREEFTFFATSKESETCSKIVAETFKHDWKSARKQDKTTWNLDPDMMSGPQEGQFLKSLVSIHKPKRILDIGMFTGYSALSMAEALPADGEMVTIDRDEYLKTLVTSLIKDSPHHKKIRILLGDAHKLVPEMAANGEQFDIIFLDADKGGYLLYFQSAFEGKLLSPGGTVVVDNAYMFGDGYMPSRSESNTRKFAEAVVANPSLHTVLVPIRDGVMLIRRKSDVEGSV